MREKGEKDKNGNYSFNQNMCALNAAKFKHLVLVWGVFTNIVIIQYSKDFQLWLYYTSRTTFDKTNQQKNTSFCGKQ